MQNNIMALMMDLRGHNRILYLRICSVLSPQSAIIVFPSAVSTYDTDRNEIRRGFQLKPIVLWYIHCDYHISDTKTFPARKYRTLTIHIDDHCPISIQG